MWRVFYISNLSENMQSTLVYSLDEVEREEDFHEMLGEMVVLVVKIK